MPRSLASRSTRVALVAGLTTAFLAAGAFATAATAAQRGGAAVRTCSVSSLSVDFGTTGLDAGHVNAYLVFTNPEQSACTIDGYPIVRFVSRHGVLIGNPSSHDTATHVRVTLEHTASAHALFRESVPGVWSPSACKEVVASGLRVQLDHTTGSVLLHFPGEVCSGSTVHEAAVAPVSAGAGPPPAPCVPGQLRLTHLHSNGAAGTRYVPLVFTNPVLYTCTLRGYPTVRSVVGAHHAKVGPAASRAIGAVTTTVVLQPFGGTASAGVGIVNTGNFPRSACEARKASGFLVTPPQSRRAGYLAFGHTVCTTKLASTNVSTVVAGTQG